MASIHVVNCRCGHPSRAFGWEGGEPIAEYRHILHSESEHVITPDFPIRYERSENG